MNGDKIKYHDGYKYQLIEDYVIQTTILPLNGDVDNNYLSLTKDGVLTIKAKYAWDGPSGPTVDTKSTMRGSLVHDALYQLIREKYVAKETRKTADEYIRDICIEDGMNVWRAKSWYYALRKFAGFAAEEKSNKKIMITP